MGKRGFSLMEIMVVVAIVGIIAAIAIPSYTGYVKRTRRAEAVSALQAVALFEEKARAEEGSYVDEAALISNYGLKPASGGQYTPSEYYEINLASVNTTTFKATAVGIGSQAGDVTLAINQDGTCGTWDGADVAPDPELWRTLRH